MRASEFIEKTNAAATPEDVFGLFHAAVKEHGFDSIGFISTTPAAQRAFEVDLKILPALTVSCPEGWPKHYLAKRYAEIDPILLAAPRLRSPVAWADFENQDRLSPKQRQLFRESREAGMHNGVSIPIHGPAGESFLISLASAASHRDRPPDFGHLHLLSLQFYVAFAGLATQATGVPTMPRLTERERECLNWSAQGKSAWATSMILGVSENTVNFHLKSGMRKLGTTNRVQAVAIAVRAGLIQP